jgi:ankyrin repeat protein
MFDNNKARIEDALVKAIELKDKKTVEKILTDHPNFKTEYDAFGYPFLFCFSTLKDITQSHVIEMMQCLFDCGVDINIPNVYGNTILHDYLCSNEEEVLLFLLEKGASLAIKNKREQTPLDRLKDASDSASYKIKNLALLHAFEERKQLENKIYSEKNDTLRKVKL